MPTKKANELHLEDLKYVPAKTSLLTKVFGFAIRIVKDRRAAERERRKHHVLAELEERVKQFDDQYRKTLRDELEAMKNAVLLEAYRAQKRIEKNSVKVNKLKCAS